MKFAGSVNHLFRILLLVILFVSGTSSVAQMPDKMQCVPGKTVGLHDYPTTLEHYEPVVFEESSFRLNLNKTLTRFAPDDNKDFVYLTFKNANKLTELTCEPVLGAKGARGLSCVDKPPAEMLLINLDNLRFTRSSIGGWTFLGADEINAGNSLFVEYGHCKGR